MKTDLRRVIIVDQFCGLTPYYLQQNPTEFDVVEVWAVTGQLDRAAYPKARVSEVPEDYAPRMCEVVIAADEKGNAFAWKMRLDSSG